jgi:hypothetical protein
LLLLRDLWSSKLLPWHLRHLVHVMHPWELPHRILLEASILERLLIPETVGVHGLSQAEIRRAQRCIVIEVVEAIACLGERVIVLAP